MADGLPPISLDLTDEGAPIVIVDGTPVTEPAGLRELAPGLTDPGWVTAYARTLNHVAHGYKYALITDPAAFEEEFLEEWDAEDPEAEPVAGLVRLREYGKPDFSEIKPPAYDGQTLVFYVRETYIGIPYKVTVEIDGAPQYAPMALHME